MCVCLCVCVCVIFGIILRIHSVDSNFFFIFWFPECLIKTSSIDLHSYLTYAIVLDNKDALFRLPLTFW